MGDERLTDDDVARVLRRATELDVGTATRAAPGLPVTAVEAAAAEVGVSPAAVRLAVAELRAGALDADDHPIVCARVVPQGGGEAVAAVGQWLKGQAMVRARDRGTEQVWRPREDLFAGLQRRFDFAAAFRLRSVDEVVVRAVEVEGGTLLRVCARFERTTSATPAIGAAVGGVAGLAAGLGAGLPVEPFVLDAALAAAGTAGLGAGGWRLGRRRLAWLRHRVTEAIDGVLDELELGRQPGRATSFERLADRARRLRGGYRL